MKDVQRFKMQSHIQLLSDIFIDSWLLETKKKKRTTLLETVMPHTEVQTLTLSIAETVL